TIIVVSTDLLSPAGIYHPTPVNPGHTLALLKPNKLNKQPFGHPRASKIHTMSKRLLPLALLLVPILGVHAAPLPDDPEDQEVKSVNVNANYVVESVHSSGRRNTQVSSALQQDIDHVVGRNMDQSALEKLAERIKDELHVPDVKVHITKGDTQDHVAVV